MDVQRREQDLNDQLQLCHDQLEAIKVLHCSSIKTVVCVCMHACACVTLSKWQCEGVEV